MNLAEHDYQMLEASYIPRELADAAGLYRVDAREGAEICGRNGKGDYSGIVIPYTWPGTDGAREYLLRLDHPELERLSGGVTREKQKYIMPPGRANLLYIPRGVAPELLTDTGTPVLVCEGAKKALAAYRLADHRGTQSPQFVPVAVSGVWNWRGTVGREAGPDGSRQAVKGPIADLDRITWQGRVAYIVYDSDKKRNPSIRAAENGLARELKGRGAIVKIVELPDLPGLEKTGLDDFLAHDLGGPDKTLVLIDSAREFEPDLIRHMHNDYGNALRLVVLYGHDLRYCHVLKKWFVFDGRRWAHDETGQAAKLTKLAMLEFRKQAIAVENKDAEKFARDSLNQHAIKAALESAQTELPIRLQDLDTHPYLLNFINGTLDLRTGALADHDRTQYLTKLVEHPYNPSAKCPLFKQFLYRIMGLEQDEDRAQRLIDWLQKVFGYSLTGDTSEKAFFICYGRADNGKTTLLSTMREVFREYSVVLQVDSLMYRRESSNNEQADLSDLRGARFAQTSETEDGQRLSAARLKRICQGRGGKMKFARKYENPAEFVESHHLFMDANFKPRARANDEALWNRIHLIPFEVTIPKHEQDRDLPGKLQAEAEGISAWVVEGARRWFAEGLGQPLEVIQAGNVYRAESAILTPFIADCGERDPDAHAPLTPTWDLYQKWAQDNADHKILERAEFNRAMKDAGFTRGRDMAGRFWQGFRLTGYDK